MTTGTENMVECTLENPDDFLKVRETLTRIGVASRKDKIIYQSCHILHKQGRYYIVHFKELFALDARRNTIANLLSEWGLIALVNPDSSSELVVPLNQLKILSFKEKDQWDLTAKYNIGSKRTEDGDQNNQE